MSKPAVWSPSNDGLGTKNQGNSGVTRNGTVKEYMLRHRIVEPWSHAAGTRPWRGDARWTESLEWKCHARMNMAAAARVAIIGLECSVIINDADPKTRLQLFLRQEYPSTPFRLGAMADGLDRLLEDELGRLPCALPDTEDHPLTLLGVVLQMVAFELDELIKAVLAQCDALSRVLPPCPGQILPNVSACKW